MVYYHYAKHNIFFVCFMVYIYRQINKDPLISRCGNLKMLSKIFLTVYYYYAQYNDTFIWKKYQKYPS